MNEPSTREAADAMTLSYDPGSYEVQSDPFPIYRRLQDEAPLYHNTDMGFWALTRFDDVIKGLGDHGALSSEQGTLIEQVQSGNPPPDMMIFKDPPQHDVLRGLVNRAFTPRRIAELEGDVLAMCAQWLDPLVEQGGGDFVADLAGVLPMAVIGRLLGAPSEDFPMLKALSDRLMHREDGSVAAPEDSAAAGLELFVYFNDMVQARRATPDDALLSGLIDAELPDADGGMRRLDDAELVMFCMLLGVAGNETTSKLIATGVVALNDFPDERTRLAADPTLGPGAVEELLRYDPPSHYQGRVATRDLEFHGQVVEKGSIVLLVNGAANRDPRAFPEPERFIADRKIARHLAFGHGVHFCLGASLARLETRVALQEIVARFPDYSVDKAGVERFHSSNVRGLSKVPFVA